MPKHPKYAGLVSLFDEIEEVGGSALSSWEVPQAPPSLYYAGKYIRHDTKEAVLWDMLHHARVPSPLFEMRSDQVTNAQLLELCGERFGISGGSGGTRTMSVEYIGGERPRIAFTAPGEKCVGYDAMRSRKPDERVFEGKRLAELVRSVLWGPVVKPENHYRPDKYTGCNSLDACLWHALHLYDRGGVPWSEVSPDVADGVLLGMVCQVFPRDAYFIGNGWNFATRVENDGAKFAAQDEDNKRFRYYRTAAEVIRAPHMDYSACWAGHRLVELVRFVLWGPALQSPESALHQARQALVKTLAGVLEQKKGLPPVTGPTPEEWEALSKINDRMKNGPVQIKKPFTAKELVSRRQILEMENLLQIRTEAKWANNIAPDNLYHWKGKTLVLTVMGAYRVGGQSSELYEIVAYEVVPEARWQYVPRKYRDCSQEQKEAANFQGLYVDALKPGKGKPKAYVYTGFKVLFISPPTGDMDTVAQVDPRTQPQQAPDPEPEEPASSTLPPAPLTAGGKTCTTHDADGNSAMLSFAHAVKAAGYGNRITTGGKLDAKKCCRACNAMEGRPASDRPQPTIIEWQECTRAVHYLATDGGMNSGKTIRALEALPCDESAAHA